MTANPTESELARMATDPMFFRQNLLLPGLPSRRFGEVMQPMQKAGFGRRDQALLYAGFRGPKPARFKFWEERARATSKTSDEAMDALWLVVFGQGYVDGAFLERGDILSEALKLAQANRWILDHVEFDRHSMRQRTPGQSVRLSVAGKLTCLRGMHLSAVWLPDLYTLDDANHWHYAMSTLTARGRYVSIMTTAGCPNHWSWAVRQMIRQSDDWEFATVPGGEWSMLDDELLDQIRKETAPEEFSRQFKNEWAAGPA